MQTYDREQEQKKLYKTSDGRKGHGYLFNKWRWTIGLFAPLPDPVSCGGYMGRKVFGSMDVRTDKIEEVPNSTA